MAGYDITRSTDYGGKAGPTWVKNGFHFPGYHNAFLSIMQKSTGEQIIALPFNISPSTFTDARAKLYQMTKTMGGWMVQKLGSQPIEINLSGYMLDIRDTLERHDFLDNYNRYIEDQKNYSSDYYSDYYTKVVIEGREYYGFCPAINFTKSADTPFVYQYNLSFVALGEKRVYNADYACKDALELAKKAINDNISSNMYVSNTVSSALGLDTLNGGLSAKVNVNSQTPNQVIFSYANVQNNQMLNEQTVLQEAQIAVSEDAMQDFTKYNVSTYEGSFGDIIESEGNIEVKITLPQDILSDAYHVSWTINQVKVLDWQDEHRQAANYDSYERRVRVDAILKNAQNLEKKIESYASTYYTSNNSAQNQAVDNVKKNAISILRNISEMAQKETSDKVTNPRNNSYRINNMLEKAYSLYDYLVTK